MSLALTACSTTEYIYVYPECEPAVRPFIPTISGDELYSVSDDTYIKLETLKRNLINWGKSNEDIIKAVCNNGSEEQSRE